MPVTNYYHVTPSGAGSKNGTTWTNAFDLSGFHGSLLGGTAGDVYWIADGTYTLSGNINFSATAIFILPVIPPHTSDSV